MIHPTDPALETEYPIGFHGIEVEDRGLGEPVLTDDVEVARIDHTITVEVGPGVANVLSAAPPLLTDDVHVLVAEHREFHHGRIRG